MQEPSLKLVKFPGQLLARPVTPVTAFGPELAALAADMLRLMRVHGGIGLAANQAGIDASLFVASVPDQSPSPLILANPRLLEGSGHASRQEGCLSLPGIAADVPRYATVRVSGQDVDGRTVEVTATGLLAACLQHELDHLAGHLFVDRLSPLRRDMLLRRFRKLHRMP